MSDNSRLSRLTAYLADQTDFPPGEVAAQASTLMAALDAVDPLRQPPSDEVVEAAFSVWFVGNPPNSSMLRNDMRRALAAALAAIRAETATQFVNCTIGDAPAGVRLTEVGATTPPTATAKPTLYQTLAVVLPMLRRYAEDAEDLSAIAIVTWAEGVLRDATDPEPAVIPAEVVDVHSTPIDMILHCPSCHHQHIDAPEASWTNPPHKSHLCAKCATIWRPCDLPTNGVRAIETCGKADTWTTLGPTSAPGHTDLMVSLEAIDAFIDANPPPDAIEDRLAALEARPQWTEEKERVVKFALNTLRRSMLNGNIGTFWKWLAQAGSAIDSVFPQPERVWPPVGCLAPDLEYCAVRGRCVGHTCPHAGEYANG